MKRDFCGIECHSLKSHDLELKVMNLGATVLSLKFRGRDMVPGYDNTGDYLNSGAYLCATVGRYANRIGSARFSLSGQSWQLRPNQGKNQLHGGPEGFSFKQWETLEAGEDFLRLGLVSPDGDMGFPGELRAETLFSLKDNRLRIDFYGRSNKPTVYSPTSHMYFSLGGNGSALDSRLMIDSNSYLETDGELIPSGRLLPAEGDYDFSRLRAIEKDYDCCFVLNAGGGCTMERSGTRLKLSTDFPGLQLYTGAFLTQPLEKNQAIALEPQFFPDSPNKPDFPSTVLEPGQLFHRHISHEFESI